MALDMLQTSRHAADLAGERILITAGATREPIDPVRFISNRSSGRMGYAIAKAAHARGAEVTVVSGVTSVAAPAGVSVIETTTANEMHRAVMERAGDATIFIAAAAVADYASVDTSTQKMKKTADTLELKLQRTPDILREVAGARRQGQLIIGFAAETENLLENAWEKLISKDLDAIVANDVSKAGGGFDSANNAIAILFRDRPDTVELPLMPKEEAAHRILDEVVKLRKGQSSARTAAAQETMTSDQTKELSELLKQTREYVRYFGELGAETIGAEPSTPNASAPRESLFGEGRRAARDRQQRHRLPLRLRQNRLLFARANQTRPRVSAPPPDGLFGELASPSSGAAAVNGDSRRHLARHWRRLHPMRAVLGAHAGREHARQSKGSFDVRRRSSWR